MKSGHSEKEIDKAFCKRAPIPRRETLNKKSNRKQYNKIKFEYEPSIYSIWRKTNHLLKNNEELKIIFKNGVKDFQIVHRKGGKNIKEWLANTNINTIDSSNIVSYGFGDCGRNCIDC